MEKASDRTVTNQTLQQEANFILETIRNEYLILKGDKIELIVVDDTLTMDGKDISNGYSYDFTIEGVEDEIVYPNHY